MADKNGNWCNGNIIRVPFKLYKRAGDTIKPVMLIAENLTTGADASLTLPSLAALPMMN